MTVRQRITVPFTGHVIGEGFNSKIVERVGLGLVPRSLAVPIVRPARASSLQRVATTLTAADPPLLG
jgi:hypothetical protein